MNKPDILSSERRIKIEDNALREHYREGMEKKRVPSDYLLMFTEGGESSAVGYAMAEAQRNDTFRETLKMVTKETKDFVATIQVSPLMHGDIQLDPLEAQRFIGWWQSVINQLAEGEYEHPPRC